MKVDIKSLLDNILTKNEAAAYIYELESLNEAMYQTNTTWAQNLKKHISSSNYQALSRYLKKNPAISQNPESFKAFIALIKKEIEQIPLVTIMIIMDPSIELKQKITQLTMKMLSRKVFIEYEKQPSLIGGAAIIYKGRYFDYSISGYLDKLYQKYL